MNRLLYSMRRLAGFLFPLVVTVWPNSLYASDQVGLGSLVVNSPTVPVGTESRIVAFVRTSPGSQVQRGRVLLGYSLGRRFKRVAVLRDDGGDSDALAGDGIFTGTFTIAPLSSGQWNLQARAKLKRVPGKRLSNTVPLVFTRRTEPTQEEITVPATQMGRLLSTSDGSTIISGRLLVLFSEGATPADVGAIVNLVGGSIVGEIPPIGMYVIDMSVATLEELVAARQVLEGAPKVLSVGYDEVHTLGVLDNDALAEDQKWGFVQARVDEAFAFVAARHLSFSPVTVAVLDTGIRVSHPEFAGRLRSSASFVTRLSPLLGLLEESIEEVDDENGHGTSVAGIIGALNNGSGLNGVLSSDPTLPYHLQSFKVCSKEVCGACLGSEVIAGVVAAVLAAKTSDIKVINMSLGGRYPENDRKGLEAAAAFAEKYGVLIVAAAGNSDEDASSQYPSAIESVLSVGAVDKGSAPSQWSNGKEITHCGARFVAATSFGPSVDIYAPGGGGRSLPGVYTAKTPAGFKSDFRGTSAATPFVAGAAAVLFAVDPTLTPRQVRDLLRDAARRTVPQDGKYGVVGVLDLKRAVELLLGSDSDGDKVPDGDDTCAGTSAGAVVDSVGCACSQKTCVGEEPCMEGSCDASTAACVFTPIPGCQTCTRNSQCADHNACTVNERCVLGVCMRDTRNCDDGKVCTDDVCNPATGCVRTNNTAICSDNNPCTIGDRCAGGSCVPGPGTKCGNGVIDPQCNEQCDGSASPTGCGAGERCASDCSHCEGGPAGVTVSWVTAPPSCVVSGGSLASVNWHVDAGAPIIWTNLWWSQHTERLVDCTPTEGLCPLPAPYCCVENSSCKQCGGPGGCIAGSFAADTTCSATDCSPGSKTACVAPAVSTTTTYYFTAYAETDSNNFGWASPVSVTVKPVGQVCGAPAPTPTPTATMTVTPTPTVTMTPSGVPHTVTIDGDPSDWAGITPLITDPAGDAPSQFDIVSVSVANDATNVYFLEEFVANGSWGYGAGSLFLDTDLDAATGCPMHLIGVEPIGAEYAVIPVTAPPSGPPFAMIVDWRTCGASQITLGNAMFATSGKFAEFGISIATLRAYTPNITGFRVVELQGDYTTDGLYTLAGP